MKLKPQKINVKLVKPDETLKPIDGWHNVVLRWIISEDTVGSELGTLGYTILPPKAQHALHVHENAEEYIIVKSGHGKGSIGDYKYEAGPDDVIFIPKGALHYIENSSDVDLLEIFFIYVGALSLQKSGYKPASAKSR